MSLGKGERLGGVWLCNMTTKFVVAIIFMALVAALNVNEMYLKDIISFFAAWFLILLAFCYSPLLHKYYKCLLNLLSTTLLGLLSLFDVVSLHLFLIFSWFLFTPRYTIFEK